MYQRALALALALLLLLAQQFGLQHGVSHDLAAVAGPSATAAGPSSGADSSPAADPSGPLHGSPADAACAVCLLLAGLVLAALPALLRWGGLALGSPAPLAPQPARRVAASGRPYQARAPPR